MADRIHGLGRLTAPDERDRGHLMSAHLPQRIVRSYRYWDFNGPVLDQGNFGTCVGHGWKHWLMASPVPSVASLPPSAVDIYLEATKLDEWPGNEGDLQSGTSVRAGAKALQGFGRVGEYLWAWTVDDIAAWLLTKGPVVMGTVWTDGMFEPDAKGFIVPTGPLAGGHCYLLLGCNTHDKRFRMLNSWGAGWGDDGRAWIRFSDMEKLLSQDGEACTAAELAR